MIQYQWSQYHTHIISLKAFLCSEQIQFSALETDFLQQNDN